MMTINLIDNLVGMRDLSDNSVDSIVTDPPYGIAFMNKRWDYDVPSVDVWKECLRVLKPGGHMLVACGTRTQHRMVVNIEDAGFEIRDVVTWLYGQGFPKSLDVSKAIDREAGAEREIIRTSTAGAATVGFEAKSRGDVKPAGKLSPEFAITAPATDAAREWEGWGTALKPACEFWTLARKPLSESTVAKNVLKWGTGGLNIDRCRVDTGGEVVWKVPPSDKQSDSLMCFKDKPGAGSDSMFKNKGGREGTALGRFPANLILDEEAAQALDEQTGILKTGGGVKTKAGTKNNPGGWQETRSEGPQHTASEGGASRFFYVAKASKSERNAGLEQRAPQKVNDGRSTPIDNPFQRGETERLNTHPTVKPVALMRYLCRLVTPPNGVVLDPFMGSGSTGVAARQEGFRFIGMEIDRAYFEIAERRLNA